MTSMRVVVLGLIAFAACSRTVPTTPETKLEAQPAIDATVDASADAALDAPVDPPGTYMGRTIAAPMSWQGASWLDRPNRDAVQQPGHVLDVLGVKAGQTVADVGCGSGYFTVHLSARVGATGKVIATDLQPEMLKLLEKKLQERKITNVTPVLSTEDDAKLPRRALDLVLLVDVYHELPKPPVTLAQIKEALAPNGRLALVEYRAEDPKVAIKPEHKTTLAQLKRELDANGYRFVASDESLAEQRIVTFVPNQ